MSKRPKPKKIRKVWLLKPRTRVHDSGRRKLLEKLKNREIREGGQNDHGRG